MPKTQYCWRCGMDIPMLDEREWAEIAPLLMSARSPSCENGAAYGMTPTSEKRAAHGSAALDRYFEITGFRETNSNALWHHRVALFGPPCAACGKPLRTPKAKLCAECGAPVSATGDGT